MSEIKKIFTTPKVRKFARELGANLENIEGSERKGRITEKDVKKFVNLQLKNEKKINIEKNEFEHSDFGEVEFKEISRVKKIAAPHLIKSWSTIPHVTHHEEIDITELENFRNSLIDQYTGQKIKITPLVFIMKALVICLKKFPFFNSSIEDINSGKVVQKKYFHIGIAVDTKHGLMVPKLRNVNHKNIKSLSKELRDLSEKCRKLKIDKKEFYGGSMTISSLGGIGGSFFTPIINYPEVAILGVSRTKKKQIFYKSKFSTRIVLPISLSYDHRVIDGAEAARFCNELSENLGDNFAYKLSI
tara:strand:- start:3910 stop:4815 length:906 start_codon:yes stop_codon:yes gene_type:complete